MINFKASLDILMAKKAIKWPIYWFLSIIVIFILIEMLLTVGYHITKHRWLDTYQVYEPLRQLPDNAEEYVKIAVFGGSSALGFGVGEDANFTNILEYELTQRYPTVKFFITNQAGNGDLFYEFQAELAKNMLSTYDILLVYAGHNEGQRYLHEVEFFYPPGTYVPKLRDLLAYKGLKFDLKHWMPRNIRIFSLTSKIGEKYVKHLVFPEQGDSGATWAHVRRPLQFESQKLLPPNEIHKIGSNFGHALRELGEIADREGNSVIISSVAYSEEYPPHFSVYQPHITDQQRKRFDALFKKGLIEFHEGHFDGAIDYFSESAKIDDLPAILNYMLGRSHLNRGNSDLGHAFIRKAIDEDGLPIRALSSVNRVAEAISKEYTSVHFVDSAINFQKAYDSGFDAGDRFIDIVHPSLLGHIIIAHTFLDELESLLPSKYPTIKPPVKSISRSPLDDDFDRLEDYVALYEDKLLSNDGSAGGQLLDYAQYNFISAKLSAYPGVFLEVARKDVGEWFALTDKTLQHQAIHLIFLALIEVSASNSAQGFNLADQAITIAPDVVHNYLNGPLAIDGYHHDGSWMKMEFAHYGLPYDDQKRKFVLK